MALMRRLERRIEALLDGMVGLVFRGPLHPMELGDRIVREADLAVRPSDIGPHTANHFSLAINPADLGDATPPHRLIVELSRLVEEAAFERGWRLDGPGSVAIVPDPSVSTGSVRCIAETRPGPRSAWAELHPRQGSNIPVTVNRAVIGRGETADVVIPDERTSRRHALLWRESDRILLTDLGSSNGTAIDGQPMGPDSVEVRIGSRLTFGGADYRLGNR